LTKKSDIACKYVGVKLVHASPKDSSIANDTHIQVKVCCGANKLRGTFSLCFSTLENTLLHAYCMPIHPCKLWRKCTQSSIECLHIAYNNAYCILYILRII